MNPFKKILNYFKKSHSPFVALLRDTFGRGFISKEKTFIESYTGWVYACVNVIASEVGNMKLRLMRGKKNDDEEDEEIFEHEIISILDRPNPLMTGTDLLEITSSHLDLTGNAFWYLLRDDSGVPQEIYPLRPDRLTHIQSIEEPLDIEGYIYQQEAGQQIPLEKDEILWFKNFNPDAKYPFPDRGRGVVQSSAQIIDTDDFAREWNRNFFGNNARPDGVLTYEGDLNIEEFERLKKQWEERHQGVSNARKVALLKGGMTYTDIGISQKDMDFVEGRRFSRDEILAMFRVPKTILGITEDVNRANAEASNFVFGLRVLKPRFQKIVNTINEFLLPMFDDAEDLFFDFDTPVPEDRAAILNEYTLGINKFLTRNEIRMREGLPETENGDEFFAPFGEVPVDRVKKDVPKLRSADPQTKGETKPRLRRKVERKRKESRFAVVKKESKRLISDAAKKRYAKIWIKSIDVNEELFRRGIDKYFDDQQERILKNMKGELQGLEGKEFAMKAVKDFIDDSLEVEAGISMLKQFQRQFGETAVDNALLLTASLPESVSFNTVAFRTFFDNHARRISNTILGTTKRTLFPLLTNALEEGKGIDEIENILSDTFTGFKDFRTRRIARTEVATIQNFSTIEGYKQLGITKIEWLVASPEDVDCISLNGDIVEIGEKFRSDTGSRFNSPPVHPNCVCTTLPVIE